MKISTSIIDFDNRFLFCIFNLQGHIFLCRILPWISRTANGYIYPIIPMVIFFLNPFKSGLLLLSISIAFAMELPAYLIIKNKVKRYRPYETHDKIINRTIPSDRFSLPSGHTSGAFIIFIILGHAFPVLFPVLSIWSLLVGLSRIYLGVHYPTDVLAGAALGSFSAIASIIITGQILY